MNFRTLLLATSTTILPASGLFAHEVATPPAGTATTPPGSTASAPPAAHAADSGDESDENPDIVVTGQKPRGSVVGDIPPENVLTSRDIRATGATSIQELLDAIAPETGSSRGRGGEAPVILLNGNRISGFGEIRDIPPEAIERTEILPEEVSLKYGYAADQRVVNIVLRRRFRSTTARGDAGISTQGSYEKGLADVSKFQVQSKGRTQITLHAEGNTAIRESDRDVVEQLVPSQPVPIDPRGDRTLTGSQRLVRANLTANRTVLGDVSATLSGEASHTEGTSLFGVPTGGLTVPTTNPFAADVTPDANGNLSVLRAFPDEGALTRRTTTDNAHISLSMNWTKTRWRYSVVGNGDLTRNVTNSDAGPDLTLLQAQINANDPLLNPLGPLGPVSPAARNRATSTSKTAGLDGTANGPLATLPAGRANITMKVGIDALGLDSSSTLFANASSASLSRNHADGSVNIDLPLTKRNGFLGAIGSLTLNGNALVDHYSDFGTLTTYGAGANWTPVPRLNLITSYTREEGAPSLDNLGDPVLITPGVRVFDYVTGRTVSVTTTTGGNPALLADRRDVWKLGANWQPFPKTDLRFRADYVTSKLTNPVETFPGPSAALEAAFPGRFSRDAAGDLTAVDFRPVNYDSARTRSLRIGFDFSQPLKSARPAQSTLDELRREFRARREAEGSPPPPPPPGDGPPPPPPGDGPPPPPPGGGFGGPGGGGGGFGGRGFGGPGGNQRGRITFSLTDTITLADTAIIRPGLPELDFLHGDAANGGTGGGVSRHVVQAQAGYFNNGLGVRMSANYSSATDVTGGENGNLHFSPLATFDLRLFANLGDNLDNVVKHPWMRGASIRIEATNLFNSKQRVTNAGGFVPLTYQPDLINPIGRAITISFRKLFIPRRFLQRPRNQSAS